MTTSTVCEEIETLTESVGVLCTLDPLSFSDPDSLIALQRASARLDYIKTVAVGEFDASGEGALCGAKSVVAWVVTRWHVPKHEAQRLARRAKVLVHLPVAKEAFCAGDIGAAQFDALAKVRTPATEEALSRDEAMLVGFAKELKYAAFCQALTLWANRADPDGATESELERQARRDVYLSETINGMFLGAMKFDACSGAVVSAELRRLEQLLFDADWAEATERLGREPKIHELRRTPAQRRADAMVEMAKRSASTPQGAQRPEPLITIMVGFEDLYGAICRIEGGPVIPVSSVFEHLDGATFERIVFAPGKRVECSVKSRFFVGATRRAIEVRDQECTHEYCDVPADRCEIDHIVPYGKDGPTTQENGRVHCGFHNRLRNHEPPEAGDHGPEPGD
jgi:hypothetical protein